MTEHKIDLKKTPIRVFYKFFTSKMEFQDMIEMLDHVVDGGIMDLPVTELPSIMSAFLYEYSENAEIIAIAIGSLKNYLEKGDEE